MVQVELMKLATQEQLAHGQAFVSKFSEMSLPTVSPAASGLPGVILATDLQPRTGGLPKRPAQMATITDEVFDPYAGEQGSAQLGHSMIGHSGCRGNTVTAHPASPTVGKRARQPLCI